MFSSLEITRRYLFTENGKIGIVRLEFGDGRQPMVLFLSAAKYVPPKTPSDAIRFHEEVAKQVGVQIIRIIPPQDKMKEFFSELTLKQRELEKLMKAASPIQSPSKKWLTTRATSHILGFFLGISHAIELVPDPILAHVQVHRARQVFLDLRRRIRQICDAFQVKLIPLKNKDILKLWFWNEVHPKHYTVITGDSRTIKKYLRPVGVPTRPVAATLPNLDHLPVNYVVGTSFSNPRIPKGFAAPPRFGPVVIIGGGTERTRIGLIQQLAKELARDHHHVFLLDLASKCNGLTELSTRLLEEESLTVDHLRLGTNFFLNPCHVLVPNFFKQAEEKVHYQADIIARLIIASLRPWKGLELKELLARLIKDFMTETDQQLKPLTFEDVHQMLEERATFGDPRVDISTLEAIRHSMARYAAMNDLNHRYFAEEQASKITRSRLTIIQPDLNHSTEVKRLMAYYLLHFIARLMETGEKSPLEQHVITTPKRIAVLITPASELFITAADRRSTAALSQIQKDIIYPFIDELLSHHVTVIFVSESINLLPSRYLTKAADAIYLRAHDTTDASMIIRRLGLHVYSREADRRIVPEDLSLQLLDDEALLTRQDTNVPQYMIVKPLLPIITTPTVIQDKTHSTTRRNKHWTVITRFTSEFYDLTLTVLDILSRSPQISRNTLFNILKNKYPAIREDVFLTLESLPYLEVIHQFGVKMYQMNEKGRSLLQAQQEIISSFPEPYSEDEIKEIANKVSQLMRTGLVRLPSGQHDAFIRTTEVLEIYQRLIRTISTIHQPPWYHLHQCLRWMELAKSMSMEKQDETRNKHVLTKEILTACDELLAILSLTLNDPDKKRKLSDFLSQRSVKSSLPASEMRTSRHEPALEQQFVHVSPSLPAQSEASNPNEEEPVIYPEEIDFDSWLADIPSLDEVLKHSMVSTQPISGRNHGSSSNQEILDEKEIINPINQEQSSEESILTKLLRNETLNYGDEGDDESKGSSGMTGKEQKHQVITDDPKVTSNEGHSLPHSQQDSIFPDNNGTKQPEGGTENTEDEHGDWFTS